MIKLLHVEDDPDIRELAELALVMTGEFELAQCETGEAALEWVKDATPDIILLDMMMPGLTGVETLREMRKLPHLASVPAAFMTARAEISELGDLSTLGATDVIAKPFDPLELPALIKAILGKARRSALGVLPIWRERPQDQRQKCSRLLRPRAAGTQTQSHQAG